MLLSHSFFALLLFAAPHQLLFLLQMRFLKTDLLHFFEIFLILQDPLNLYTQLGRPVCFLIDQSVDVLLDQEVILKQLVGEETVILTRHLLRRQLVLKEKMETRYNYEYRMKYLLRVYSDLLTFDLLLPLRHAFLILSGLGDDCVFLGWVCPYYHPQHPVNIGEIVVVESTRPFACGIESLYQQVKSLERIPVSPLSFRYRVGF